jgi:hypothetical protein
MDDSDGDAMRDTSQEMPQQATPSTRPACGIPTYVPQILIPDSKK